MIRRTLVAMLSVALLLAHLGGCDMPSHREGVWLTRYGEPPAAPTAPPTPSDPDAPPPPAIPTQFYWKVQRAVHTNDPRGQFRLLAESAGDRSDRPIRQILFVELLWRVSPFHTGTDESAMNARIGYLIQAGAPQANPTTQPDRLPPGGQLLPPEPDFAIAPSGGTTLYYEGMGNVYTDTSRWRWGGRRFQIRHALLRLTRSNTDRPKDPFGVIALEADLPAIADPEADKQVEQVARIIAQLRPPLPPIPASRPDEDVTLENALKGD